MVDIAGSEVIDKIEEIGKLVQELVFLRQILLRES